MLTSQKDEFAAQTNSANCRLENIAAMRKEPPRALPAIWTGKLVEVQK